ncbi:hypothetical protein [Serinicoccus sediminis]|uniref:hypothetical protein n=1 Tax=Serinicoccus sediminis TaxID=2306021 RepID=UPI001020B47B|nr:hypothetical protein [Serinicoccus sediminis]
MRGRPLLIVAVVLVVGLLVWLQVRDGSGEDDGGAGSAAPQADPTSSATATQGGDEAEATTEGPVTTAEGATPREDIAATAEPARVDDEVAPDLVDPVVDVSSEALSVPTEVDWDAVVSATGGDLLQDLEASVLEYTENGWTQEGSPELVESTVLEVDEGASPPTARVEVCLDYAQVNRLDANGESLTDPDAEQRVRSIYELEFVEGRWVGVAQTFDDDITC